MVKKTTETKKYNVVVKNIAQSPYKLRLVVDLVRGMKAVDALTKLEFLNKKGSFFVKKAIMSGIANAQSTDGVAREKLFLSALSVDGAHQIRKVRFASRGRVSTLHKRRSHLNVQLTQK